MFRPECHPLYYLSAPPTPQCNIKTWRQEENMDTVFYIQGHRSALRGSCCIFPSPVRSIKVNDSRVDMEEINN